MILGNESGPEFDAAGTAGGRWIGDLLGVGRPVCSHPAKPSETTATAPKRRSGGITLRRFFGAPSNARTRRRRRIGFGVQPSGLAARLASSALSFCRSGIEIDVLTEYPDGDVVGVVAAFERNQHRLERIQSLSEALSQPVDTGLETAARHE